MVSEGDFGSEARARPARSVYSRLPPRSAYAGGGTPSGVQGAEPPVGEANHLKSMMLPHNLRQHGRYYTLPIARRRLAELAHRWIPGRIVALQQPAPVGIGAVQQPHGAAEGAGEVRDRGIHRNHQVQ